MKAVSIRQPWCHLIFLGLKTEEYRSWPTNHRGTLLIHASQSMNNKHAEATLTENGVTDVDVSDLPRGAVIGTVDVVDCLYDPAFEEYVWILENPELFDQPIPFKGRTMLFDVPDVILY